MAVGEDFLEHLRELLAAVGPLRHKRMFGGVGLYCGEVFFAVVDDDTLFLKVDDETRPRFVEAGSRPFTYGRAADEVTVGSYYSLPESAFDDADEAADWARLAIATAMRKPGKRRR